MFTNIKVNSCTSKEYFSLDKVSLMINETYTVIWNSRKMNPLYKNLKNRNLELDEKAIAISSLITKFIISCQKIESIEDREKFMILSGIKEYSNAIQEYMLFGMKDNLLKYSDEIIENFNLLNL